MLPLSVAPATAQRTVLTDASSRGYFGYMACAKYSPPETTMVKLLYVLAGLTNEKGSLTSGSQKVPVFVKLCFVVP